MLMGFFAKSCSYAMRVSPSSKLVSKKWPKWFVAIVSSRSSAVICLLSGPIIPALLTCGKIDSDWYRWGKLDSYLRKLQLKCGSRQLRASLIFYFLSHASPLPVPCYMNTVKLVSFNLAFSPTFLLPTSTWMAFSASSTSLAKVLTEVRLEVSRWRTTTSPTSPTSARSSPVINTCLST